MDMNRDALDGGASSYLKLIDIGIALSAERDYARLLERILLETKEFTGADAGTLYLNNHDRELTFQIVRNDSLGIAYGGTTGAEIKFKPVPLVTEDGKPNLHNVASYSAITGQIINIPDAYSEEDQFDFSGTKRFDALTGYRSQSFLTVPLKNHESVVIGVMQLINAKDSTGAVVAFDSARLPLVEALASQAAVSIDNHQLIEAQKQLLDSFIELIAAAIDAKSPYTGGHCQRVPELTKML
ncbi:MAG TPA: GAF domain-containing protein, partial [Burkholderiales bacterium]|nr:GAF domain-containing protein [Burkholderiales bacterium]